MLVALTLLAAIALPALAHTKARSQHSTCANNLQQIGQAFRIWANDDGDMFPWNLPTGGGGSQGRTLAWEYFSFLSNELVTARILACPSDNGRAPTNFVVNMRKNNNLSYFVGTHAKETDPDTFLSGDRDILGGSSATCVIAGNIPVTGFTDVSVLNARWSLTNHVNAGNLVWADGRAESTSNSSLRRGIVGPVLDVGLLNGHILKPYILGELSY